MRNERIFPPDFPPKANVSQSAVTIAGIRSIKKCPATCSPAFTSIVALSALYPSLRTCTMYDPASKFTKSYPPSSPVTTVSPPGTNFTLTVATGSPVVLSETLPEIPPAGLSTPFSLEQASIKKNRAKNRNRTGFIVFFLKLPHFYLRLRTQRPRG